MRYFKNPVFILFFALGALAFGYLVPRGVGWMALAFLLSFGGSPAPILGILVAVALVVFLGVASYRRPHPALRGAFLGSITGVLAASIYIPLAIHRDQRAVLERQRTLFAASPGLHSLQVTTASGTLLWRISATDSASYYGPIRYGVVPPGFTQQVPTSGPPRPLVAPESLELLALSDTDERIAKGPASGPDSIAFLTYIGRQRTR